MNNSISNINGGHNVNAASTKPADLHSVDTIVGFLTKANVPQTIADAVADAYANTAIESKVANMERSLLSSLDPSRPDADQARKRAENLLSHIKSSADSIREDLIALSEHQPPKPTFFQSGINLIKRLLHIKDSEFKDKFEGGPVDLRRQLFRDCVAFHDELVEQKKAGTPSEVGQNVDQMLFSMKRLLASFIHTIGGEEKLPIDKLAERFGVDKSELNAAMDKAYRTEVSDEDTSPSPGFNEIASVASGEIEPMDDDGDEGIDFDEADVVEPGRVFELSGNSMIVTELNLGDQSAPATDGRNNDVASVSSSEIEPQDDDIQSKPKDK